jgi:hypothetical protein
VSWDWVPPRPGEQDGSDGGPSPALRRAVTVLAVLVTGAFVAYYLTIGVRQGEERCVAERPAGVSEGQVESRWRWWPPGTECVYPAGTTTDVARA